MNKLVLLGLGITFISNIVIADMQEDLKYVAGKAFEGQAEYAGPQGQKEDHSLELIFEEPETKGSFSGEGRWIERFGEQELKGQLTYEVSDKFLTIKLYGGFRRGEQTSSLPTATFTVFLHPAGTTGVPSLDRGYITAYTGEYFRHLRSQGFLGHRTGVVPAGTISVTAGPFAKLQWISLLKK